MSALYCAMVAQWLAHLPLGLEVPSSIPAHGEEKFGIQEFSKTQIQPYFSPTFGFVGILLNSNTSYPALDYRGALRTR